MLRSLRELRTAGHYSTILNGELRILMASMLKDLYLRVFGNDPLKDKQKAELLSAKTLLL